MIYKASNRSDYHSPDILRGSLFVGNSLDNLAYAYNIQGWLKSINKSYVDNGGSNYFGMDLGYDRSTAGNTSTQVPQFNGNIASAVWRSAGDGVARKYDYKYDNANRITRAEYSQNTSGSSWDAGTLDFSVYGWDSDNGYGMKYDANGNILMMIQKGWKGGQSAIIDALAYTYYPNSNRLKQVANGYNDKDTKLGNFHYDPATKTSTDYTYDANGNLIQDNNKKISSITYNYLNLPQQIIITGKGTITYTYDAAGNKLQKTTADNTASPSRTTTTLYLGPAVYQNDTLQLIAHEEGRARWAYHKYTTGGSGYGFEYDFFEKDHLGNTRVVLSQEKDTAKYLASGEAAYRSTEARIFDNLATTSVARSTASGYPNDVTFTNPNDTVFKVNGNTGGHKTGPSLLLKVMSGDKIDIGVQEYYNSGSASTPSTSLNDVLASLATGIVSASSGVKGSVADLNNTTTSPVYAALNSFLTGSDPTPSGKPKAYLNWILLDEQLKYVSSYPQSGALVVGAAGTLNSLSYTGIPITKSGYLYIWVSNETPNWDVFFDNLAVKHYSGPLLEETHYYPFGLTMAGISSKALKPYYAENKYRYNDGTELANKEFSDGSGLELYETTFRGYDPQIGRFTQVDPLAIVTADWSPYSYALDNPLRFNDPLGLAADTSGNLEPVIVVGYLPAKPAPPPDVAAAAGPAPSSVPDPIKEPDDKIAANNTANLDKGDHNVFTDAAYLINKFNPLAQAVNLGYTIFTHHDSYDRKQDIPSAITNFATTIPIGRVYTGLNIVEAAIGSTGRTVANNLTEQLAMEEIKTNPLLGGRIVTMKPLTDPRWKGWFKMTNFNAHGVEIHFNALYKDGKIIAVDDFKFK